MFPCLSVCQHTAPLTPEDSDIWSGVSARFAIRHAPVQLSITRVGIEYLRATRAADRLDSVWFAVWLGMISVGLRAASMGETLTAAVH